MSCFKEFVNINVTFKTLSYNKPNIHKERQVSYICHSDSEPGFVEHRIESTEMYSG